MAAKAISEAKGKQLLSKFLGSNIAPVHLATYNSSSSWEQLVSANPWLLTQKLVAKPDQLIKRRGKLGLIKVNADLAEVKKWIEERCDKEIQVGKSSGRLTNFIIEPFVPHNQQDEYYICIYSHREGETILFHHEGGVDVGDVDAKALKINVPIDDQLKLSDVTTKLLINVANQKRKE
jgi:ATP citrate (pro-S)-lyase